MFPSLRRLAARCASAVDDADELLEDHHTLATARRAVFTLGQTRYNWDVEKSVLLTRIAASLSNACLD